jgi:hypothetical protein
LLGKQAYLNAYIKYFRLIEFVLTLFGQDIPTHATQPRLGVLTAGAVPAAVATGWLHKRCVVSKLIVMYLLSISFLYNFLFWTTGKTPRSAVPGQQPPLVGWLF